MAGKGSRRRPSKVPQAVADANYEAIFGHFVPLYLRKKLPDESETISEVSKLIADETLQATEPKQEDNK